jgi:uncharacterized protein
MITKSHFLKHFRILSLPGLVRYLFVRMRGKSILVTGSCRGCGMCCRNISLEGREGWLRSEKAFYEIVIHHPDYRRFAITGKDSQGFLLFSCTWSTPEGTCRDHENRLSLCRKFPESSLVFAGGRLPLTCGYRFVEVVPFQKFLSAAMQKRK